MDAEGWRGWYEERAAIREYDGGFDRHNAELLAYLECLEQYKITVGVTKQDASNALARMQIYKPTRSKK